MLAVCSQLCGIRFLLTVNAGLTFLHASSALALAMARDGSSGGVIRTAVITESGIEREMLPGDKLPRFWQG